MRKFTGMCFILMTTVLIAGCLADQSADILPTATPLPTAIIATITPTPTPLPTVTPFPTGNGVAATTDRSEDSVGEDISETTPSATSLARPTTAPPAASSASRGRVIYSTDFSQGWPTMDEPTASLGLADGRYVFEVGPFDGRYITTTVVSESVYLAEVDVHPEVCPAKGGFGLLFNYADSANYYAFTVYCDNRLTVVGRQNGALFGVGVEGASLPGGLTASGGGAHLIAVMAKNGAFTLYFDDQVVATFSDDRVPAGDIAVYATSQGGEAVRVGFDNLTVYELN